MIDADFWSFSYGTPERLLVSLIDRNEFEVWTYGDDGPEPNSMLWTDWGPCCPGWAILGEQFPDGERELIYSSDCSNITYTSISERRLQGFIEEATSDRCSEFSGYEDRERYAADFRAAQVAKKLDVDMFVSNRTYLLTRDQSGLEVDVVNVDAGIVMASLFLRRIGIYFVDPDNSWAEARVDRGSFYLMALRAVLPGSWSYTSLGLLKTGNPGVDRFRNLAWSSVQRVQRVLMTRDELHLTLNRPQTNLTADDAAAHLNHINMLLVGAFDAAARFVHELLDISGSRSSASWHHEKWVGRVGVHVPRLAGLYQDGEDRHVGLDAYNLVRKLRNFVHEENLTVVNHSWPGEGSRSLLRVPEPDRSQIRTLMSASGSVADWGVQETSAYALEIDAGYFVEKALPLVIDLLNSTINLLAETYAQLNNEVLIGVEGGEGIFRVDNLQSVRRQIGI